MIFQPKTVRIIYESDEISIQYFFDNLPILNTFINILSFIVVILGNM